MKLGAIITHALVALGTWLLLTKWEPFRAPETSEKPTSSSKVSIKHQSSSHPKVLLESIVHRKMESRHREALKAELSREWAERDPASFLEFLRTRPWGYQHSYDTPADRALRNLARSHPDLLLDWARTNGCALALEMLVKEGHPHHVLELLRESSPAYDSLFTNLFQSGIQIDPDFHRQVHSLKTREQKTLAMMVCSSKLALSQRWEEYTVLLHELADDIQAVPVMDQFAGFMVHNRRELEHWSELPDNLKASAVPALLDHAARGSTPNSPAEDPYYQSLLTELGEAGYLSEDDWAESVVYRSGRLDSPNDQRRSAESWKNWALKLPEGAPWDRLSKTALEHWATIHQPTLDSIPALTSPRLRDYAYFHHIKTSFHPTESPQFADLTSKITNPDLRARAQRGINWLRENQSLDPDSLSPFFNAFYLEDGEDEGDPFENE